jgi:hypothetical protein
MGRKDLIELARKINLNLSMFQATECALVCRGRQMEESGMCDYEKLVSWFVKNLKVLRPVKTETTDCAEDSLRGSQFDFDFDFDMDTRSRSRRPTILNSF